jgi:mono/diheme cytochrome c family protein
MRHQQILAVTKSATLILLMVALFAGPILLQAEVKTVIKHVPTEPTVASDGAQMFKSYCAVCHGENGKGKGVAAPALRKAPEDLTVLAKHNGGKFPELRVIEAIRGDLDIAAHGSKDMPVWGMLFRRMHDDESVARLRMFAITKYIESMQSK